MAGLIVAYGEALVDLFPSGEVIGGAPLNFAFRASELGHRLGYKTAIVTRLGRDDRGHKIRRLLEKHLVCDAVQTDPTLPTGTVHIEFVGDEPHYTIDRPAAWDAIEWNDLTLELAKQSRAVCFGTLCQRNQLSAATLREFLASAKSATKILDLNLRLPMPALETIEWSLLHADVLKCNEDELLQLRELLVPNPPSSPVEIASQLQEKFRLDCVFWTRGQSGCCWQSGHTVVTESVPEFELNANRDSVGAGDAACAALVLGIVEKWSPIQIVHAANWCGACVANQRGATCALPDQILQKVLDGAKLHPPVR